jgi:hypothetical protein
MDLGFTAALNTQPRSWFLVVRLITPLTSGNFAGFVNQPGVSGQDAVVSAYIDATTNNIGIGPSAIGIRVLANVPAATMSNVFLTSIVNSTTAASNALTVNGTALTLTGSSAATGYRTASSTYMLGTDRYTTTVDLMEVLFYYGAVTSNQRQQVEGYLAWKWGLQSTLPSSHPYSKFRP